MKKRTILATAVVMAVILAGAINASAALTTYYDRPTWLSHVSGVSTIDFNGL